jgi:pimeloyl-ACP methyl ester carboxylesterase
LPATSAERIIEVVTPPRAAGRLLLASSAALITLAACSGSDAGTDGDSASAAASRSLFQLCSGEGLDGWTRVPGAPGNAVTKGEGPVVVMANDLTNAVCGWIPIATELVGRGYRVVLFQYADTTPEGERSSVARTLEVAEASAHAAPYVLLGANFGGRIVIETAARRPEGLRAIVSVSGELEDNAWRSILAEARAVGTPALYVGSRHDQFTDGTRQQRVLHGAMHGSPNELVQYPGSANGMALLDPRTPGEGAAMGRVVAFVTRLLPQR